MASWGGFRANRVPVLCLIFVTGESGVVESFRKASDQGFYRKQGRARA